MESGETHQIYSISNIHEKKVFKIVYELNIRTYSVLQSLQIEYPNIFRNIKIMNRILKY